MRERDGERREREREERERRREEREREREFPSPFFHKRFLFQQEVGHLLFLDKKMKKKSSPLLGANFTKRKDRLATSWDGPRLVFVKKMKMDHERLGAKD